MARISKLENEICYVSTKDGEGYLFYGEEGIGQTKKLEVPLDWGDSETYYHWLKLEGLSSFHFSGANGYFTARREEKRPGERYWYAYRKAGGRQYKKYLGTTEKLSIQHLETVAQEIQINIDDQGPVERKPRKQADPKDAKAALRFQIAQLKGQVAEQEKYILQLEQELRRYQITTPPRDEEYPLKIWALQLTVEECLKFLQQTPGCHARPRSYVDESNPNALLMIWYKDQQYAPTKMNELRYITQQIHIDGLREGQKQW